jgi:hypothetical protein
MPLGIPVTELAFNSSGKLFVYAEEFSDQGYITTWNNATWSNLVTDFPIDVNALVINNSGKVYIGGGFDTVGECWSGCFSVAQLNGSTWSPLGQHGRGPDGFPSSLAVAPDGDLYLGGAFSRVGACIDCFSIVHGEGSNWQALSNGPMHAVTAIAFDSAGNLYAGGFGGVSKWDGASWALLGADIFAPIYSMVFDANDTLYIGGNFIVSDCIECYNIAKWGGTAWEPLDIGIFDPVRTLAVGSDNTLYVGGDFTFIPGSVADCGQCTYIASWNGAWAPLASTPNGPVRTLALDSNDTLYAGGSFNTAGSCFSNCLNIAMWNGSDWNSLGSGTNNRVDTLAVDSDDTLYAGGGFTSAGTCIGCNNIARWDGTTWHDLDNGTDGWVTALAIGHTGRVYAAGQFSHAGDKISRNFAAQSVKVYLPFMVR